MSEQAVCAFVGVALPGTAWIVGVDLQAGCGGETSVPALARSGICAPFAGRIFRLLSRWGYQFLLERPARLDEQTAIDQFVRYTRARIARILSLSQPAICSDDHCSASCCATSDVLP